MVYSGRATVCQPFRVYFGVNRDQTRYLTVYNVCLTKKGNAPCFKVTVDSQYDIELKAFLSESLLALVSHIDS